MYRREDLLFKVLFDRKHRPTLYKDITDNNNTDRKQEMLKIEIKEITNNQAY